LAWLLIIVGAGVCAFGYANPNLIGGGTRPYAYLSVIGVGAMLMIAGALLRSDT
jgi:hypothetical protein